MSKLHLPAESVPEYVAGGCSLRNTVLSKVSVKAIKNTISNIIGILLVTKQYCNKLFLTSAGKILSLFAEISSNSRLVHFVRPYKKKIHILLKI